MTMLCAEWWAFEIATLFAGLFGEEALAAQAILLNTCYMFYSLPGGLAVAASTRVGNSLGAQLPKQTKVVSILTVHCRQPLLFL